MFVKVTSDSQTHRRRLGLQFFRIFGCQKLTVLTNESLVFCKQRKVFQNQGSAVG